MAYNLEEQEQLDVLKNWWKQYGNLILTALTIFLFAFSAYMGWKWYQRSQAAQATLVYEALEKAVQEKELGKVKASGAALLEKYPGTAQAEFGALLMARAYYEANDLPAAKAQLQWLIDHAKHEEHVAVARVRLAGILLDEKSPEAGLKVLAVEPPAAFAALFADRRGDLLVAQNKTDEARKAYEQALALLDEKNNLRVVIELKRDALGLPVAAATAATVTQ